MADTWSGNADNQAITFKALINYKNTAININYDTTPPDTRECVTVGDLNTYGVRIIQSPSDFGLLLYNSFYSAFSFIYSDGYVLTKSDFIYADWVQGTQGGVDSCGSKVGSTISGTRVFVNPSVGWVVGAQLYTTVNLSNAFSLTSANWLRRASVSGVGYYVNTSGVIEQINSC